jgi:hypothetical protein
VVGLRAGKGVFTPASFAEETKTLQQYHNISDVSIRSQDSSSGAGSCTYILEEDKRPICVITMNTTIDDTVEFFERLAPELIYEQLKYVDIGTRIELCHLSSNVRRRIIDDDFIWKKLARKRLGITLNKEEAKKPFETVLKWCKRYRCGNPTCHIMEVRFQRPLQHPLFRHPICRMCSQRPEFRLISATDVKKHHHLNERDLLPLRVLGTRNPRYANASPARYFAEVDIIELEEAKLAADKKTLVQRRAERDARSLRVKSGKAKAKEKRADDVIRGLEALGILYDGEGPAFQYIGLHWSRREKRLSLKEVLDKELKRHYLIEHGGFVELCAELRRRHGGMTGIMEKRAERFALSTMELICNDIDAGKDEAIMCGCGKWKTKEQVIEKFRNSALRTERP